MKKWIVYIITALFCGFVIVLIGTVVRVCGLQINGGMSNYPTYYLIYYTDFLLVCCTGIIVAKIDQLRDDLRKK